MSRLARGPEPISSTEIFKQLHETGRHAFGLYVGWFTFFNTLNFVALGWLATRKKQETLDPRMVAWVAVTMIFFIALGALSAGSVNTHLRRLRDELVARAMSIYEPVRYVGSGLPLDLYARNLRLMTLALYALSAVWFYVLWGVF